MYFFPPSSSMLLHIPHTRHLQKLLLLPFFQRAIIYLLASVFHTRQQVRMLIRKMMMFLDVCPKFFDEGVPVLFVGHTFKISSSANASYLPSLHSSITIPDSRHSVLCQRPTSTLKPTISLSAENSNDSVNCPFSS